MSISYDLKCDICGIEAKELIKGIDEARLMGWSYISLADNYKDICPSCILSNPNELPNGESKE